MASTELVVIRRPSRMRIVACCRGNKYRREYLGWTCMGEMEQQESMEARGYRWRFTHLHGLVLCLPGAYHDAPITSSTVRGSFHAVIYISTIMNDLKVYSGQHDNIHS
jgi:hypothetical protein